MYKSADVDEFDVFDLNLIIGHLSNDKPSLKLVDSRNDWSISPKAKKLTTQESTLNKTKVRAIVVLINLKSGVLSFIQKFETKKYLQNYFMDINDAIELRLIF